MRISLPSWIACAALVACGQGEAPNAGSDPLEHPSIDDLPGCDPSVPGYACLQQLFLPLDEARWPFDARAVRRAWVPGGVFVLPNGRLTALHVIDGDLQQRPDVASHPPDCYAGEATFSAPGEVLKKTGCADFLFLGGGPTSLVCQSQGITTLDCTDRATVADTYDIGLVATDDLDHGYLTVTDDVEVGEQVFLVGDPRFLLAVSEDELDEVSSWFGDRYPVVSSGTVLAIDGGGIVVSNLAFFGNSGGPLLNRRGEVLGVASTLIGHLRAAGTATDPALPDHRTVIARLTPAMIERIEAERALMRP